MILHWEQLLLYYGESLKQHQDKFEKATQTTYGLLACRNSPTHCQIGASAGEHAEQKLLGTVLWTQQIVDAIGQSETTDDPIVTTIVLNRSPCQNCSGLLVHAIDKLHQLYPFRAQHNRFILASLGAYEDSAMKIVTTQSDLVRLRNAGWELAVLQFGASLSQRGNILLQGIQRIAGHGHLRLEA